MGETVGDDVGLFDGDDVIVGKSVGNPDGFIVGRKLGEGEGSEDGDRDGDSVKCSPTK